MEMACAYGADAVYLAGEEFGMRAFAGNFPGDTLRRGIEYCHDRGVRVYVTCNTMARNEEIQRLPAFLEHLEEWGADAVITADAGVFDLARRHAPHVRIHMSTQAGIFNYESARVWHDLGAARVILARELSLEEIRELRLRTPADLELEVFVHGAMCVSYSGRCVLSNYMTGRDAQRGACAQPCRYRYALMEEKRPGEYFPVEEDDKGAYIFSSRDMCMIDHIPDLLEAGVSALKIEGRGKSAYYTAAVTGAYRHAVDAALRGEELPEIWRQEVDKVSHRHYSTGFFYGQPGQYTEDTRYIRRWQVAARVESCDEEGLAELTLHNQFGAGDEAELIGPGMEPLPFTVPEMEDMDGMPLTRPKKPEMRFRMRLPRPVPPLSLLRIPKE